MLPLDRAEPPQALQLAPCIVGKAIRFARRMRPHYWGYVEESRPMKGAARPTINPGKQPSYPAEPVNPDSHYQSNPFSEPSTPIIEVFDPNPLREPLGFRAPVITTWGRPRLAQGVGLFFF